MDAIRKMAVDPSGVTINEVGRIGLIKEGCRVDQSEILN